MSTKKLILIITGLIAVALLVAVYLYFFKPEKKSTAGTAVGTAEKASESVPEINTNPADKIPEVNPLDRANPFKYINPLR